MNIQIPPNIFDHEAYQKNLQEVVNVCNDESMRLLARLAKNKGKTADEFIKGLSTSFYAGSHFK